MSGKDMGLKNSRDFDITEAGLISAAIFNFMSRTAH
jgi:hypothetical protein